MLGYSAGPFRTKFNRLLGSIVLLPAGLLLLCVGTPRSFAQAARWAVDPEHSEIDFTVRHLSVTNVHGHLGKLQGTLSLNQADLSKSHVEVTIDVDSVTTGESSRDTVLKSGDFFDTERFPTAMFKSTSVVSDGLQLRVAGNLTMHGVTKLVELDVRGPLPLADPGGHRKHSGYEAATTISRAAFGIGTEFPSALVGDEVKLSIVLDLVLP